MAANVDSECKKRSIKSPIFNKKESAKVFQEDGATVDDNLDDKNGKNKDGSQLKYWPDGTVRSPRCDGLSNEVPPFSRVRLIESGYRVDYVGTKEVASTICKCHNDTVNIWTHLIGSAILFVFAIIFLVVYEENHSSRAHIGWN